MNQKVLITVPDLSRPGGVAALYNILRMDNVPGCEYFELHGKFAKKRLLRPLDLFSVFASYILKLQKFDIIHVNPSLDKKSFIRDGILVYLALFFNKKVVVYWHGWQETFEEQIYTNNKYRKLFNKSYLKADLHIVLGTVFKNKLVKLGVSAEKIKIESNAADDSYLKSTAIPEKTDDFNILFIARLEVQKGIYIAIEAVALLQPKYRNLKLLVAGGGGAFNEVKKYTEDKGYTNVVFAGHIGGKEKHDLFAKADTLLFPTYHPEGMPISIIEAMLYGLPVISRPVGGIPDWVHEGENGYLTDSLEPAVFAQKLELLLTDVALRNQISKNNSIKAQDYFTPDKVKQRLLDYYKTIKR